MARSAKQVAAQKKAAKASALKRSKASSASNPMMSHDAPGKGNKPLVGPTGKTVNKSAPRGSLGGVPKRYAGNKIPNVRKAAAAQRRGNFLFAVDGNRTQAHREYSKASRLLGR